MKIKDGFILREIAGNNVVIACGDDVIEFTDSLISVNEIGAIIWTGLTDGKTKDEIVEDILKEYDVTKDVIDKDFDDFIEILRKAKIIVD